MQIAAFSQENFVGFGRVRLFNREMQIKSDARLLREYAETGSDAAFGELVERHAGLVYSAASRQVGPDLASDIAQTVFVDLARKASSLADREESTELLLGWLYKSTRYAALNVMRTERRRQQREREAMKQLDSTSDATCDWDLLEPMLDEAMAKLKDEDRDVLLLRFFKGHGFREVGVALGISNDTAQKRVIRALEKLRTHLAHRGITTTATALTIALSANVVDAVPVGINAVILSTALAQATVSPVAVVPKFIIMTTAKNMLIVTAAAVVFGTITYETIKLSDSHTLIAQLHHAQISLSKKNAQLKRDHDEATNQLVLARNEIALLRRETAAVPKLRGHLAQLERDSERGRSKTDRTSFEVGSVIDRINVLKANLEQRPNDRIPEFQLLQDGDWVEAVTWANTETETDIRKCLSHLRTLAKMHFSNLLIEALRAYTAAHDGNLPTDLLALKPYLTKGIDEPPLERYKLIATGSADILKRNDVVMEEKAEADKRDDIIFNIGMNVYTCVFPGNHEAISHEYEPKQR